MKYLLVLLLFIVVNCQNQFAYLRNTGSPNGFLTDCPGWNSTTTISPETLRTISVTVHEGTGGNIYRKAYKFPNAAQSVIRDPKIDLIRKKTLVSFDGYLLSPVYPHNKAIAQSYSKRNYNVIQLDTLSILSRTYPVAARLTKPIGLLMGDFLFDLYNAGLNPKNLELLSYSIGGHTVAFAAERFYQLSGRKPARLTGLDPAGPCFRNEDPALSIRPELADHVDVIHTNMDGFGTAEVLGHVDFYVNGGEYQPSSINGFILPCLIVCSHLRAVLYWWMAIENPDSFLAIRCSSVHDARRGRCYDDNQTINEMGLKTDFSKEGIFYVPIRDAFPYFAGSNGIKNQYKPTSYLKDLVPSGNVVV